MTLLLRVKSENSYIYREKVKNCTFDGFSQIVATNLASRKFNASQWVCKFSVHRAIFPLFDFTTLFSCIMADIGDRFCSFGSPFCPVSELCYGTIHFGFTLSWTATVSLQSQGLIFWIIPSWMAGKYIFHDAICRFCLFLAFLNKKCQKHRKELVLSKNKHHIWTHDSQIPIWTPISFHYRRKKILAPGKRCTHMVLFHCFDWHWMHWEIPWWCVRCRMMLFLIAYCAIQALSVSSI